MGSDFSDGFVSLLGGASGLIRMSVEQGADPEGGSYP
jgi:hypothetical protein